MGVDSPWNPLGTALLLPPKVKYSGIKKSKPHYIATNPERLSFPEQDEWLVIMREMQWSGDFRPGQWESNLQPRHRYSRTKTNSYDTLNTIPNDSIRPQMDRG
jgi:hypothetical protein